MPDTRFQVRRVATPLDEHRGRAASQNPVKQLEYEVHYGTEVV
jgi:hypothetical protein